MPQTMNPIAVQKITGSVGAFLGPNIAAANPGAFHDSAVPKVVVQVNAEPERDTEYAISGTIIWDPPHGAHEVINMHSFYLSEYDRTNQSATFLQHGGPA